MIETALACDFTKVTSQLACQEAAHSHGDGTSFGARDVSVTPFVSEQDLQILIGPNDGKLQQNDPNIAHKGYNRSLDVEND